MTSEPIEQDFASINECNSAAYGYTRLSFTEEYECAISYVRGELAMMGYEMRRTAHGNCRFRKNWDPGQSAAVAVGSHLDTVPNGGAYDGTAGVVAAIEVARMLERRSIAANRPFEVVIFAEEEGSRFGSVLAGSRAMAGSLSAREASHLKDAQGVSYVEELGRLGISTVNWNQDAVSSSDYRAYLELHIEQSIVLHRSEIPVGIVTGIAGIHQYRAEFSGRADHAGATPMGYRKDALAAAAEAVLLIERLAQTGASGTTVGTVGWIDNYPNVANVIPNRTALSIDLRDVDQECLRTVSSETADALVTLAHRRGIEARIEQVSDTSATLLPETMTECLRRAANRAGICAVELPSGAVHDASEMTKVTEVGMLFVPSVDGRSHCAEEQTHIADVRAGIDVLYNAVVDLLTR